MARDKTFSARDVIRIWSNHLTKSEQTEVACFFNLYVRGITQVSRKQKLSSQLTRKLVSLAISVLPPSAFVDRLLDLFEAQISLRELTACENEQRLLPPAIRDSVPDFNELIVDRLLRPP